MTTRFKRLLRDLEPLLQPIDGVDSSATILIAGLENEVALGNVRRLNVAPMASEILNDQPTVAMIG